MREEWTEALISQGQLANKKRVEEEEKAKQETRKTIVFNVRSHEERKVMMDFLKTRGESGKRLVPMSFMNLQALYIKVKKEERLGKIGLRRRVDTQTVERKQKKPKPTPSSTPSPVQKPSTLPPRPPSSPPKESKYSHPAPPHQLPPKKKAKPPTTSENSREIVIWFYSEKDQWFEVFRGRTEVKRSMYKYVDEVMQLPNSDLQGMMELGEAGQKMICSSKSIFSMPSKDIKSLSELPPDNPSKDHRGYETATIVAHMKKIQQQRQQIISSFDFATDTSSTTLTQLSAEVMLLVQMIKDKATTFEVSCKDS
ncbi:hypothetical protein L1987_54835 [Smallanthus sonchifolius]|uniref:Uncharacterized protein n=1 Tax=Smallanthus sonchifolius TaxID=185202 RepID=A0ACB9E883_9ASTR|nr:hypothetical protein L1987_54835 [Smallanthus sonchifolius]